MKERFACARAGLTDMLILLLATLTFSLMLLMPLGFAHAKPLTTEEARLIEAYQSGDVIRLHILADSDTPEAQRIKLSVRDALLDAFGKRMKQAGVQDSAAVYALLNECKQDMLTVAAECARENGFTGNVTAAVGVMELPEKTYGSVTLPKGAYHALRITLGSGQGQNWWCILFPDLCLAAAGEQPWQTEATDESNPPNADKNEANMLLLWDAERIFRCWTLLEPC